MTLDDLLIYGDWLEENDIKNSLYKIFLNLLRIKLIEGNNYGFGNGFGFGFYADSTGNSCGLRGNLGCGTGNSIWGTGYGCVNGNGGHT